MNFINTGLDDQILKSLDAENPSEELIKAMNKQGLVQKEVQVKTRNGVITRKQWVKAGEDQKSDKTPSIDVSENDSPQSIHSKVTRALGKDNVNNLEKFTSTVNSLDISDKLKNEAIELKKKTIDNMSTYKKNRDNRDEKENKSDSKSEVSFDSNDYEDMSVSDFLGDMGEDFPHMVTAAKDAGVSNGNIISSDSASSPGDISAIIKASKKVKSYSKGCEVYENNGSKFVYVAENGMESIWCNKGQKFNK